MLLAVSFFAPQFLEVNIPCLRIHTFEHGLVVAQCLNCATTTISHELSVNCGREADQPEMPATFYATCWAWVLRCLGDVREHGGRGWSWIGRTGTVNDRRRVHGEWRRDGMMMAFLSEIHDDEDSHVFLPPTGSFWYGMA